MIFTQRCGLFLVWNEYGTVASMALANVQGVSFRTSGVADVMLDWSVSDNLIVEVISYYPFYLE